MAIAPARICIPATRVAQTAAEYASKSISGFEAVAYSLGAVDFLENETNVVTFTGDTESFDQFTLNDSANQPTFIAGLTEGEFKVMREQESTYRWGWANTTNITDGIVIAAGNVSRDALLTENLDSEVLFDSREDWVDGETTQTLRAGRRFDIADTIVIYYHLTNPNANLREWTFKPYNVAATITGGYNNNQIQTLSDTAFRITTGANSTFTAAAIEADPATMAFQIWAG